MSPLKTILGEVFSVLYYSMKDTEARKNSHSSLENKASRTFHGYV